MKKLLYNRSRDTIFNLNTLVKIKWVEEQKIIILEFPNHNKFSVFPGYKEYSLVPEWYVNDDLDIIRKTVCLGNYDIDKNLYEYFEHKFTKSGLCQEISQDCSLQ